MKHDDDMSTNNYNELQMKFDTLNNKLTHQQHQKVNSQY